MVKMDKMLKGAVVLLAAIACVMAAILAVHNLP